MKFFTTTPERRATKANKKVGKALSVFSNAADQLDAAAAEHIARADQLADAGHAAYLAGEALYDQSDIALADAEATQAQADKLRSLLTV